MPRETLPNGPQNPDSNNPIVDQANAEVEVRLPINRMVEVRDSALSVETIQNRTWEQVHPADLGQILLNALRNNQISPATVSQLWKREPWRMLDLFGTVLANNTPMAARLQQWRQVAQTNPQFEPNFRATNVDLVQRMDALQQGLEAFLNTQQASRQQLEGMMARQASNPLDRVWRDYRRSINFQRDPALSAGLLIGGVMVGLWLVKGKSRLARWARFGAAFTVLAVFLRKNYGIQITEDLIARPLEQWGAPQMANAVRVFRDTLRAPFVGTDQQGSAVALIEHRLNVNGRDERTMLAGILKMSPGKFIDAYNAAKRASLSPAGASQLPDEVRDMIREFQRNHQIADHLSGLNDNEKLRVFLRVADKFLATLPNGRDPNRAIAFLQSHFVNGQAYQRINTRAGARRRADGSVDTSAEATITDVEGLETARQATSHSDVSMLDVFLATAPDDFWNGPNSLQGFQSVEARRARELREGLFSAARAGRDTVVNAATSVRDFVVNDAVPYLRDDAWPRVRTFAEGTAWPLIKDAAQWVDNQQYTFRKNTALGQLLESVVGAGANAVGETITVSGREMKKLSVWVAWKRVESTGVSFNEFARFEDGDSAAGLQGVTRALRAGTSSFPIRNEVDAKIWRSLHDLGIVQLSNRNDLGTSTDVIRTGSVTLSPEQVQKLLIWLDAWRELFRRPAESANGDPPAGSAGGPPPLPGSGPGSIPTPGPSSNPSSTVPNAAEETALDFRKNEIEDVDIGRGIRGLFAEPLGDGTYRVGFRPNPGAAGDYFTSAMTRDQLVNRPLADIVNQWRNGVPGALQTKLSGVGSGNPLRLVGTGAWDVQAVAGDNLRYTPRNVRLFRPISGATRLAPVATSHLTDLIRATPEDIIGRYQRLLDTTDLDAGDPLTLP